MRCRPIRKHLLAYVEGRLSGNLLRRVQEHISHCESCARETEELACTVNVLRTTEYLAMSPNPNLRSRVISRIKEKSPRRSWAASRMPAYSAAALLLIFAVVLFSLEPTSMRSTSVRHPKVQQDTSEHHLLKENTPPESGILDQSRDGLAATPPKLPHIKHSTPKQETKTEYRFREYHSALKPHYWTKHSATDIKSTPTPVEGIGIPTPMPEVSEEETNREVGMLSDSAKLSVSQAPHGGATEPQHHMAFERKDVSVGEYMAERSGAGNVAPSMAKKEEVGEENQRIFELECNLRDFPTSRVVLEELLIAYQKSGRIADEYTIATRLTKLDPNSAGYWFSRAQAAEKNGMPRTAAAAYKQAIKLGLPDNQKQLAEERLKALETQAPDGP